jgi:hypothetical protein
MIARPGTPLGAVPGRRSENALSGNLYTYQNPGFQNEIKP